MQERNGKKEEKSCVNAPSPVVAPFRPLSASENRPLFLARRPENVLLHRLERVINSIHRRLLGGKTAYEFDTAFAKAA